MRLLSAVAKTRKSAASQCRQRNGTLTNTHSVYCFGRGLVMVLYMLGSSAPHVLNAMPGRSFCCGPKLPVIDFACYATPVVVLGQRTFNDSKLASCLRVEVVRWISDEGCSRWVKQKPDPFYAARFRLIGTHNACAQEVRCVIPTFLRDIRPKANSSE
jgi:hypothetical protein